MIGYVMPDVNPMMATADKRMQRLAASGPWMYQMHPKGTFASWRTDNGHPRPSTAFGKPRDTKDGLIYYPPAVLPQPHELLKPQFRQRDGLRSIQVDEIGTVIQIMPVYMTPRQFMDDNRVGDFTTRYGRTVMELAALLYDRQEDAPAPKLSDHADMLLDCVRMAIMHTYRSTLELITDLGWVNEGSVKPIWEASIYHPKSEALAADKP
jgi:hypothetical protein